MLCHRAEVAKNSSIATTDCVFCNVIGSWKILHRKQSVLMKPEESTEGHQTFPLQVGSGRKTNHMSATQTDLVFNPRLHAPSAVQGQLSVSMVSHCECGVNMSVCFSHYSGEFYISL